MLSLVCVAGQPQLQTKALKLASDRATALVICDQSLARKCSPSEPVASRIAAAADSAADSFATRRPSVAGHVDVAVESAAADPLLLPWLPFPFGKLEIPVLPVDLARMLDLFHHVPEG